MPGGTQTTKGTNVSMPYPGVRDLLDKGFKDALRAYKEGYGSNIYTGSLVVPYSDQTMQGMRGITGIANDNMGKGGLTGNLQDIINNGGFNNYQSNALDRMQGQFGRLGVNGLSRPQDDVLNRFQQQMDNLGGNGLSRAQDTAMRNYRDIANTDWDINATPGFKRMLNRAENDARNSVNMSASAAGRYGGAVHQGEVAREVGDVADRMMGQNYYQHLNRQDAANNNMANLGQQGLGNIQGFGQNISALGQQGIGNVQGLAGNIFNAGQAGLGNMTNAYTGMKAPYTDMMGVGSQMEDLYKRQMDDKLRIFNAQNEQPWQQLARLMSIANGGTPYATTNSTTTAPGPNPWLQGLGGIATLNGLLGTGGLGSPTGLLGGLF